MMALSGVRSSWLMVARKRLLDASACSAAVRASSSACSCDLPVGDVAHHGDDLGLQRSRDFRGLLERPAAHLDPDEIDRTAAAPLAAARHVPSQTKFDAARLAAARGVRKRGEIGRAIGDVDAVEQAVPQQPRRRRSQHRLRRRRNELHGAVAAVARNHVAHVARQQTIAIFLDIEQRDAGARQRLRAEGQPGGIERRRGHAERHEYAAQGRTGIRRRQQCRNVRCDQQRRAGQRQRGGERHHAARCRQCGLQRNDDQPDRGKGFDAAGGHRHRHHEARQRQRRQHMRAFVAAGARQKPRQQDRRDQPGEGRDLERGGRAAHGKIDRECREGRQAAEQPRRHEGAMPRTASARRIAPTDAATHRDNRG